MVNTSTMENLTAAPTPCSASEAGDHLPGQLELHGHNGTRKPDIGEVEAHQHPVLLALRENKTRRGDIGTH